MTKHKKIVLPYITDILSGHFVMQESKIVYACAKGQKDWVVSKLDYLFLSNWHISLRVMI